MLIMQLALNSPANHPNLLGASYDPPSFGRFVAKPMLGREGASITVLDGPKIVEQSAGSYGNGGYIYQEMFALPETAPGCFPVVGSWIIDGVPAGMGIREGGLITGSGARFVPHVVDG